jgi:hypothetical protein
MAKNVKKKLQRDEFDLDNDLDFDDFGMDDISSEMSPESSNSKSRSPVTEVFKGTISGAAGEVVRPEFLAKTLEGALPETFSTSFSTADKVIDKTSKLYDDTIRELKPQLNNLGRKIDKLVPQEEGFLRRMTDKFLEMTGGKDQISNSSSEGQLEQSINSTIAGVFAANQEAQIQMSARSNAQENVREGVAKKRFDSEIGVLGGIHDNIARLTSYNDTVTQAYQKKSLELQLRSFFAQKELLDFTRKYQEVSTKQFEVISKNTALPEFVKIHQSERFKEELQNRAVSKITNKLFGDNSFVDNFFKRLTPYIGEKVSEIAQGIEQGAGAIDMIGMGVETNRSMGGSAASFFGESIGSMGAGYIRDLLTPELRKEIEKEFPDLKMTGQKWANLIKNPHELLKKFRKSDWLQGGLSSDNIVKRLAAETLSDMSHMGDNEGLKDSISARKIYAGDVPGVEQHTNSKMFVSVTEIIPGYLARMYRELKIANGGGETTPLTVFDEKAGEFKTEDKLKSDVLANLEKTAKDSSTSFNRKLKDVTSAILGNESTPEEQEQTNKFLAGFTFENSSDTSMQAMFDSKSFKDLPSKIREKLTEKLFHKLGAEANPEREGNKGRMMKDLEELRSMAPNIQGTINDHLMANQTSAFNELGIVKMDSGGKWSLDSDKYKDWLLKQAESERLGTSDINAKTNITNFNGVQLPGHNGKSVLESLSKTGIFNWNYKKGLGEDTENAKIGPMAQEVKANFGNAAAPDGKKIDLVSMNGIAMAAIKELDGKVSKVIDNKPENVDDILEMAKVQTDYLKQISENTKLTNEKMDNLGKLTLLNIPGITINRNFFKSIGSSFMSAGKLIKDMTIGTGRFGLKLTGGILGAGLKGAGSVVGGLYKNKDKIDSGIRTVGRLGRDLITNVGDMAYKGAERLGGSVFKMAASLVRGTVNLFIDTDIYIKGELAPRIKKILVESGEYYDKQSGTVIKKFSDIKGDIVDKSGNIVISASDLAKGLVDRHGHPIKTMFKSMFGMAASTIKLGAKVVGAVASGAWKLATKGIKGFRDGEFGIGFGNTKIFNVLVEIRDLLKGPVSKSKKKKKNGKNEPIAKAEEVKQDNDDAFKELKDIFKSSPQGQSLLKFASIFDPRLSDDNESTADGDKPKKKGFFASMLDRIDAASDAHDERVKKFKEGLDQNKKENFVGPMPEKKGLFSKLSSYAKKTKDKHDERLQTLADQYNQIKNGGFVGPMPQKSDGKKGLMGNVFSTVKKQYEKLNPAFVGPMPQKQEQKSMFKRAGEYIKKASDEQKARMVVLAEQHEQLKNGGFVGPMPKKKKGFFRTVIGDMASDFKENRKAIKEHAQQQAEKNKESKPSIQESSEQNTPDGEKKPGLFSRVKNGIMGKLAGKPKATIKMPGKADKGTTAERLARIAAKKKEKAGKFNDADGDGRRSGSWMDIFDRNKDKTSQQNPAAKGKTNADPDMTVKYKDGNGLGSIMSKLMGVLSGAGSLISGAFSIFGTIGKLGKGLMTMGRALPLAKTAMTALRAAPAIASVVAAGTMGGGLATGLAVVAGVGSFLVGAAPYLLAAGIGYGAYKGVKYLMRNNLNKYEKYRAYQYGFSNSSGDSQHHHKVIELENLIIEKHLAVSNGDPKIASSLDWKDVSNIFGVNIEDKEQFDKLKTWFKDRFRVFFINHLRVLYNIDKNASLNKVDKLEPSNRKRYLELSSFDDGPHDVKTSPVKDVPELSDNREIIKIEIKNLLASTAVDIKLEPTKVIDSSGKVKREKAPSLEPKKEDKDLIKPPAAKTQNTKAVEGTEDGKTEPKTTNTDSTGSLGGMKTPGLANGPMRDGSTGMQFISLKPGVDIENLHPEVRKNLLAMAQEYGEITGKSISLNDAFRSYEKQAEIHRRSPGTSAAPGKSLHEFGLAMDADRGIMNELDKLGLMKKYGFTRPVGSEPWHFEPAGIQMALMESKKNPAVAADLINYGVGRGGGGYGTIMQGGLKGRNHAMAKALLDATANGTINNQLTEEDVNLAGKAMSDKPLDKPAAKTEEISIGGASSFDAMGNFTGMDDGSTIKAAKAPASSVLRTNASNSTYDALGNVTGSEDGKIPQTDTVSKTDVPLDINAAMQKAASQTGVDLNLLKTFATLESNMNPNAKNPNSSATGLFQFTKGTWMEQIKKYGRKYNLGQDASPTDPLSASLMAGEYIKTNLDTLSKVKPNPDDLDLYLAHFLGPAGASKFLSAHPNVPGSQLFPAAASSNKEIFFDGRRPRTLAEIYELFKKKVSKAGGKALGALKAKVDSVTGSTPSATTTSAKPSTESANSSSGIQNASYQDVPQKKSFTTFQQAPDLQSAGKASSELGRNTMPDLNIVNNSLGESLSVQKQMLDVLSKIHGLISNKGSGGKSDSDSETPAARPLGNSKKESLPNPALDLRRRSA